ncbi:MAG: DUF2007 domain-containing protein [Flavobacteriales bacterium]|nr:DUF2007 domain-containing protein [Flavobacteriales bacterium]
MDWVCVFTTTDLFLFEQLKMVLQDEGVVFKERNTVSSMYNNFGSYELYVNQEDKERAEQFVKDATG